jgi:hypothetical protein
MYSTFNPIHIPYSYMIHFNIILRSMTTFLKWQLCLLPVFLFGLLFDPDDGDDLFFCNVGEIKPNYMRLYNPKDRAIRCHVKFDILLQDSQHKNSARIYGFSSRVV